MEYAQSNLLKEDYTFGRQVMKIFSKQTDKIFSPTELNMLKSLRFKLQNPSFREDSFKRGFFQESYSNGYSTSSALSLYNSLTFLFSN